MNDTAIKPSGDIDRDFVAMMSPHHQGAIDMAISELRYGKNEQLRRIAQEIIVDQQQEIAAMKLAIGEPPTDTTPAPTQQQPASTHVEHHHSGMQMNMPSQMQMKH
jgi:transcription termination factor Rho